MLERNDDIPFTLLSGPKEILAQKGLQPNCNTSLAQFADRPIDNNVADEQVDLGKDAYFVCLSVMPDDPRGLSLQMARDTYIGRNSINGYIPDPYNTLRYGQLGCGGFIVFGNSCCDVLSAGGKEAKIPQLRIADKKTTAYTRAEPPELAFKHVEHLVKGFLVYGEHPVACPGETVEIRAHESKPDLNGKQGTVDSSFSFAPGCYAFGDCCQFPLAGADTVLEHVGHARASAKHAVLAALGKSSDARMYEYSEKPLIWNMWGTKTADAKVEVTKKDNGLVAAWKDGSGKCVSSCIMMQGPAPTQEELDATKGLMGA
eukprot:g7625.t1